MKRITNLFNQGRALTPLHLLATDLEKDAKTQNHEQVQRLLKKKLLDVMTPGNNTFTTFEILDDVYMCPTRKKFTKFAFFDQTDKMPYVKEKFDCDNFALLFKARIEEAFVIHTKNNIQKGIAVGIVYGWFYLATLRDGTKIPEKDVKRINHAMNVVITAKRSVYLFEPQNDKLYKPDPRNRYRVIII